MSSKDVIIADILSQIPVPTLWTSNKSYYFGSCFKSLHGIDISMSLSFYFKSPTENGFQQVEISLIICHGNMFHDNGSSYLMFNKEIYVSPVFNEQTISATLDKMLEILGTLKFNKYNGIFSTETCDIYLSVNDFFKDVNGLVLQGGECSICLELINTKTECKHYLCVPCYQQINLVGNDEDEQERPCPMCREDINYTS
jgi:hypothetical protein